MTLGQSLSLFDLGLLICKTDLTSVALSTSSVRCRSSPIVGTPRTAATMIRGLQEGTEMPGADSQETDDSQPRWWGPPGAPHGAQGRQGPAAPFPFLPPGRPRHRGDGLP